MDDFLMDDKLMPFTDKMLTGNDTSGTSAGYYLAYDSRNFYLYIEAEGDSITFRDRAYQNGDGFHMMLGKPQTDGSPTDEFYVMGFSPDNSWSRKMVWYYNKDLAMKRLGPDVKFETACRNGKISFELLLPWKDVHPWHPWLTGEIAFNLCFVKAHAEDAKNYFFVRHDEKLQSEQSERDYVVLDFTDPPAGCNAMAAGLAANHAMKGESLKAEVSAYLASDSTVNIMTKIISGEEEVVFTRMTAITFSRGFSKKDITIEKPGLIPGGYRFVFSAGSLTIGTDLLTVMPDFNPDGIKRALSTTSSVSPGSRNTLMFYTESIDRSLAGLKNYESSYSIRDHIGELESYMTEVQAGIDPLIPKKGVYRRAYYSVSEKCLLPYSVSVPENYNGDRKFPLLVYLHGSGQDDRALSTTMFIPEGFVVLAPGGRGTSNCYSGDLPQADIENALKDVIHNFNVDTTKIILSGFSMGGYGVYRTFYAEPARYSAIAVISGHPDLGRMYIGENEPSFLDDRNLVKFSGIPVFIFHGKKDLNCPFALTETLVSKLKSAGCKVTFVTDDSGHGNMSQESFRLYLNWLKSQVQ